MLTIYKPQIEDLWFKSLMMNDCETMSYNNAYGGIIPFPQELWADWYARWVDNQGERYYRYLRDEENNFVGSMAYYPKDNKIFCDIVIYAKERHKGYGTEGLSLLCAIAKSNHISELYDDIALDNPSIHLFLKEGFIEISRNEEVILVRKVLK